MREENCAARGLPNNFVPSTNLGQVATTGWIEADRLEALAAYDILDTPREPAFDEIVQLAADIFDAPIAALCLIADGRQWFKAEIGLRISEVPFDVSICAHGILKPGVFVIPDLTTYERFACNPLVTGEPHLRFYAGALLETPAGLPLGTLCVLDTRPRPDGISERQGRALKILASQVIAQLELRRTVAKDQEREQLRKQAQRIAGLGVWNWKPQTQDLEWSDELCRIAGRDPATPVTFDSAFAFVHPDDRQSVQEWLLDVAKDNTCYDRECRIVRPSGEVRHCWVEKWPMFSKEGRTTAVGGLCQDITQRKQAEDVLRESERRLRTVFSHAMVGILHRDSDQRVLMVNDRFCEFVGRSADELVGLSMETFTHPEDVAWNRSLFEEQQKTGEPFQIEKRYLRPDGSVVWCAVHVSFVCDEQGNVTSTIVVAEDITTRRGAEQELRDSKELLQTVIDGVADLIFVKDLEGRFKLINRAAAEGFGMLLGHRDQDFLPEDTARRYLADDRQVMTSGELHTADETIPINGKDHFFQTVKVPWHRDGEIIGVIGVARDISERQEAEEALRESEKRLELAAKITGIGIWDYDARTGMQSWSRDLRSIFGVTEDVSADIETFLPLVHPDDLSVIVTQFVGAREPSACCEFDAVFRIQRASDGAWRWITAAGRKLLDNDGVVSRVIVSLRDVTEQRTAEESIRWAATHDPLTQLPNRSLFKEQLDQALHQSTLANDKLGLLLLDVDQFKQINDTLGHGAGDALLKSFAERLRSILRSGDLVARLAGDEFGVILQNIRGEEGIQDAVASILERLHKPFIYDGRIVDCRVSIGASLYPDHAENSAKLLKCADIALLVAKEATQSGLKVFDANMRSEMQRRFSMLDLARAAVDAGRIMPFYQPKIELHSGKLTGFEALLRWRSEGNGIQMPASIAAAFEDLNLATAIGKCMLGRVVGDMRRWLDQGIDFGHVALNASAAEFRHDNLAERILEGLQSASVPTSCLELEVTETVFLGRGAEYVERALKTLSAAGVRIALDDFGTGYASLLHLKQFPVDIIKIDQSFVRDLEEESSDAAIVRAILSLGKSLGIKVVAEGIETSAQAAYLLEHGCDYGQGYLFGKAASEARIPQLISNWALTNQWRGLI